MTNAAIELPRTGFSGIDSKISRPAVLYICYYNVTEPLVSTQVIAYLRTLAFQGFAIHLLTFESGGFDPGQSMVIERELASQGIIWHHLSYHRSPSLPATAYDIATGILTALKICRRYHVGLLHARSHVAAAMAAGVKRLTGIPFLFDIRGLLAEEYVEAGHWHDGGLKYRLTKALERDMFRRADAFVVLTHIIREELLAREPDLRGREEEITVIPCCVDMGRYAFNALERQAERGSRGWTARQVLVYVGKIGTWYMAEEMVRFFQTLLAQDARWYFQVFTQSEPDSLRSMFAAAAIDATDFNISYSPPDELPRALLAADAAVSLIKATPSKRASSPTKFGECMAAGLPCVINAGVGDTEGQVERYSLGVVLRDMTANGLSDGACRLRSLVQDATVAERCRQFALAELSLADVAGPLYLAAYEQVIGQFQSARVSAGKRGLR